MRCCATLEEGVKRERREDFVTFVLTKDRENRRSSSSLHTCQQVSWMHAFVSRYQKGVMTKSVREGGKNPFPHSRRVNRKKWTVEGEIRGRTVESGRCSSLQILPAVLSTSLSPTLPPSRLQPNTLNDPPHAVSLSTAGKSPLWSLQIN